jgi:hypothetical protein
MDSQELVLRRVFLRFDFQLYERVVLEVVLVESLAVGRSLARIGDWGRVAGTIGIRKAHLLKAVGQLEGARVLVCDWVEGLFGLNGNWDLWRRMPRSGATGTGWGCFENRQQDFFPEPNLGVELARCEQPMCEPHGPMSKAGESGDMSVSTLVSKLRSAVNFPDSGQADAAGFRRPHDYRISDRGKCGAVPGVPVSGRGDYTLRNGSELTFDVTFKGLSEEGQHAIEELMRFLGQRELRRYGMVYWLPIAARQPDRLLEHARDLLSKAATGFQFGSRSRYCWSTWKKGFGNWIPQRQRDVASKI